ALAGELLFAQCKIVGISSEKLRRQRIANLPKKQRERTKPVLRCRRCENAAFRGVYAFFMLRQR
ncbi:MAG TPA: hypothetical protein DER68_06505, partial [Ruminococcaceae bacterium]|nr:hypothetical protein [Oscillospiraceae bacterium]